MLPVAKEDLKIEVLPTNFSVKCNATQSQDENLKIAMRRIEIYVKHLRNSIYGSLTNRTICL